LSGSREAFLLNPTEYAVLHALASYRQRTENPFRADVEVIVTQQPDPITQADPTQHARTKTTKKPFPPRHA
jgi:hypothetical protein